MKIGELVLLMESLWPNNKCRIVFLSQKWAKQQVSLI